MMDKGRSNYGKDINIYNLKQLGQKVREKKQRVYVDFKDLEKLYDRLKRETLQQVMRTFNVGGKP